MPHDALGEVDPAAYDLLSKALASGEAADFEAVPLGGYFPLGNPLSVYSFQLEGTDPHYFATPPAPTFDSDEVAGEIIELYWLALCRDIAFTDYGAEPLTLGAIDDLKQFSAYADVDTSRLFRNLLTNDLTGPYLSQFFWLDVPYGLATLQQKFPVPVAGQNYMTDFAGWLKSQNGLVGGPPAATQSRYIMTGRDLAEWVHKDFTYQGFLNAALILDGFGPDLMDENNPYRNFKKQGAYITFGLGDLATLLPAVSLSALKAAFYQQWLVHRRCRPEEYGGRVHNTKSGQKDYPLHLSILKSTALAETFKQYASYLLPMAYPEGCPPHPCYPAVHATVAGACATVLKAFYKESATMPAPQIPTADGSALRPYSGDPLTVGGELDKLAVNIAFGRCHAGVHWRSDCRAGLHLGEAVAIHFLRDVKPNYREEFAGFSLTKFDGKTIVIE